MRLALISCPIENLVWIVLFLTTVVVVDGLTEAQRRIFLNAHNDLRNRTRLGLTPGQPAAKYLPSLVYNLTLEESAQRWSANCTAGHDKQTDRNTTYWPWVGQNWAGRHDWENATQDWFSEYVFYNFKYNNCSDVCGHYTQVVWATTLAVGCGMTNCAGTSLAKYGYSIVCNYGPGGNYVGQKPYEPNVSDSTNTVPVPAAANLTKEQKDHFLNKHNFYRNRTKYGETPGQPASSYLPPLVWDDELAAGALRWSANCTAGFEAKAKRATTKYINVGQNWAGSTNWQNAVQFWYDNYKYYNFKTNVCSSPCNDYKQVVWNTTVAVGCGMTYCMSATYSYGYSIACNYGPAGNVNGIRPYAATTP